MKPKITDEMKNTIKSKSEYWKEILARTGASPDLIASELREVLPDLGGYNNILLIIADYFENIEKVGEALERVDDVEKSALEIRKQFWELRQKVVDSGETSVEIELAFIETIIKMLG